jgi:uncharacterized protein (DUF3084 family)
MKNFLISLFVVLFLNQTQAQIDYPKYTRDSLGQKIVMLTVEQAIRLDNNSEILALFEKMDSQISIYDSVCIKVVNDKEKVISSQKLEISKLKETLDNKSKQVISLQNEVAQYIIRVGVLEQQVENRNSVIDEKNIQITGLKTKMIFGGVGGGLIILGLVGLIILIN